METDRCQIPVAKHWRVHRLIVKNIRNETWLRCIGNRLYEVHEKILARLGRDLRTGPGSNGRCCRINRQPPNLFRAVGINPHCTTSWIQRAVEGGALQVLPSANWLTLEIV